MPQIVQIKSRVIAAITEPTGYTSARKKIDQLAGEYGLKVADMPMAIQAMTKYPEVLKAIRTITWPGYKATYEPAELLRF